jgi:hypothetical protein
VATEAHGAAGRAPVASHRAEAKEVAHLLADGRLAGATLRISSGRPYELRHRGQVVVCATLPIVLATLRGWAGASR